MSTNTSAELEGQVTVGARQRIVPAAVVPVLSPSGAMNRRGRPRRAQGRTRTPHRRHEL